MDVAEWPDCQDPTRMLRLVRARASKRKFRLFACACCRRIWHLMTDERSRTAVEVAERYADGRAGQQDRVRAMRSAERGRGTVGEVAALACSAMRDGDPLDACQAAIGASRHAAAVCADALGCDPETAPWRSAFTNE